MYDSQAFQTEISFGVFFFNQTKWRKSANDSLCDFSLDIFRIEICLTLTDVLIISCQYQRQATISFHLFTYCCN